MMSMGQWSKLVPGLSWAENQDGGGEGTITVIDTSSVYVRWDNGNGAWYRLGDDDGYDIKLAQ